MSGSNEGRDASQAPTPSNADTQIEPHRPLGSHYQQMLSLLQVAMHRSIFHTEHEDYPFWATALTYAVEKYMHRTAAVVPQSKIWARPQVNRKSAKRGKGAIPASSVPADSMCHADHVKNVVHIHVQDDAPVARTGERSETGASHSCSTVQRSERVENNEHPTPSNSQQAAPSLPIGPVTALIDFDPDAEYPLEDDFDDEGNRTELDIEEDPNQSPEHPPPSGQGSFLDKLTFLVEECDQSYDASFDSARTTDTGARKKVITDFGVLTPRDPNTALDPAQLYAACSKVRRKYGGIKTVPHGAPSDYVDQFRSYQKEDQDVDDGADDDDDDSDDDSDDEDRPDPPIVTPARGGFNLRPRTRSQATAPSSSDKDQPHAGRDTLSWLERDMVFDESDDSPHDEVCNTEEAFEGLDKFAEFYIAILCEGKRGPSRSNKKGRFTKKIDVWKHQNNVVGMVMVSDYWCWNEFERIPGRDSSEARWQNYTDETRPFKTCNPWSRLVQWGSPASDQALANMMERVNQLYPAFSPSPTVDPTTDATPSASETMSASGSSGPTAVATPADAPSSADAPGSANLEIPSRQPADTGEETRTLEQYQETHEDELSHNDDEARSLPIEHDGATGEPHALDIDVTMHELEPAPNAVDLSDAPSARTPFSRMNYQDSEVDDGPPPFMANVNAAVIGSGPDSRRLCEEGTRATFNDSTVIGIGDDAGQSGDASLKPPDGEEIQGRAQDVSTLSAPLRPVDDSTNGTINSSERWRRDAASVQPRSINAPVVTTETGSLATPSAPMGASASATAVPLVARMLSRDFVRTATQDTEPDSGPTGLHTETGDNGTNNRVGQTSTVGSPPVRKSLYGQNTQAALDGLAAISISNNESTDNSVNAALENNGPADVAAVPASVNPGQDGGGGGGGGGNGSGGTGAIPVNPDNPLKRPVPDDPDEDMGEPRAAKKAKRAPAVTEPPAQAGPGPSTQHARGKAAPKRVRKKVTVEPSTRTLRSRDKAPKKG
ncbi:hypothetical protein K523DRAFT_278003 [Schizophyllum commune Tattone D]|nr:hypothetical protein K523DRAFT_278003 [Schizophyllum commune Tattone D]